MRYLLSLIDKSEIIKFDRKTTTQNQNIEKRHALYLILKSVHFGHAHSQLFAPVNTRVHEKVLSLSYHAIVIFEQLNEFFSSKAHFPANVFHEITTVTLH